MQLDKDQIVFAVRSRQFEYSQDGSLATVDDANVVLCFLVYTHTARDMFVYLMIFARK